MDNLKEEVSWKLGRPRHRWEVNIKVAVGSVWTGLDGVGMVAAVVDTMGLGVP
jgi:hypothetical protein